MKYEYEVPEGKKVVISRGRWNKFFGKRGRSIVTLTEAYVTNDRIIFHHVISPMGKIVFTLLLPIFFVIGTLQWGVKETVNAILDVYLEKKRGKFSSDILFNNDQSEVAWNKTMKMLDTI